MRVHFTRDYDYVPSGSPMTLIAYRAGTTATVKRECGEAAIAAGAAEDRAFNGADPAAFDHDDDGQAGGSAPAARDD